MSLNNKRGLWRTTAVALAGAVLASSFAISPASAAPINPNTVDGSQTGSITIHKFVKPPTFVGSGGNNRMAPDTSGLTPLPGVTFQIQQVKTIDLTTNAGWQAANTLSNSFDPKNAATSVTGAGYTLGTAASQVTDAAGTASFPDLGLGLYLVTETNYPAGVTPSAPFLVTVPVTDTDNLNAWLYDVDVYPKNSVTTAVKTVQDASAIKLGDAVDWTITADIPTDAIIDGYKITDKLDTKLTYVPVAAVTLNDGTALTAGTDYNVNFDASTNTVSVVFTPAGRLVLAAHNNAKVQVVVNTTVNTIGEIANEAVVYPNEHSFDILPGEPGGPIVTPPVVTKWGNLTLEKINENDAPLTGASFSVYANEADAKAGTNPINLAGETVFTVGADGQLTITGLRYSDYADGVDLLPTDANYRTYYLVETQAPSGYELLAEPISFLVNATTSTVGIDLQVKNVPSNGGFELPFTGGPGTTLLYGGGILLLAGASLLLVRNRRTNNN